MQILKSIPVHATVQKTLTYILNTNKTEDLLYTASMNCMTDPHDAYYNMKMIYEGYSGKSFDAPPPKKGKGRVKAIHYIQSFSPEENITPEQAHRIAKAFAKKTFGDKAQFVIATHVDKSHIHSHILLNVYSITGRRFYDNMESRNRAREYNDRVCQAFGIKPIIPKSKKTKNSSYAEWNGKRKGTSWKEMIRVEIDTLLPNVKNIDELLCELEMKGYTIRRGKHFSVKATGQKRAVRLENLGDVYTVESLAFRIEYNVNPADYSGRSQIQIAYENVIGQVTLLANNSQKIQRKRNSTLPYSPENDLDLYRLSAQLTVINRDKLGSVGEIEGKIASLYHECENARLEINILSAELEKLNSLAEQAGQYFTLKAKGMNLTESEKLVVSMDRETLERNGIRTQEDLTKIIEQKKEAQNRLSELKEHYSKTKDLHDVYQDIVQTYRDISEGDYISRLVEDKKKEEQQNLNAAKKRSR